VSPDSTQCVPPLLEREPSPLDIAFEPAGDPRLSLVDQVLAHIHEDYLVAGEGCDLSYAGSHRPRPDHCQRSSCHA